MESTTATDGASAAESPATGTGRIMNNEVGAILVTEAQIRQRVEELGAQIAEDYAGTRPLLVGVLRGAFAVSYTHLTLPTICSV